MSNVAENFSTDRLDKYSIYPSHIVEKLNSMTRRNRADLYKIATQAMASLPLAMDTIEEIFGETSYHLLHCVLFVCYDDLSAAEKRTDEKNATFALNRALMLSPEGSMVISEEKAEQNIKTMNSAISPLLCLRFHRGLSQKQLADKSGIDIRRIQRIEAEEISLPNITGASLIALADALKVDPRILAGNANDIRLGDIRDDG